MKPSKKQSPLRASRAAKVVKGHPSKEGLMAEKALKMAVAGVIEEHRRLGLPIAVMKNGKAVYVSVNEKVPALSEVRELPAPYAGKKPLTDRPIKKVKRKGMA
jgi:hypothetical protein